MHAANAKIQFLEAELQRLTATHPRHQKEKENETDSTPRSGTLKNKPRVKKTDDRLERLEDLMENMMKLHNATAIPKRDRDEIVSKLSK